MVRFTVRDGSNGSSIRMEMEGNDMLDGVREAAEEYWGRGRVMLIRDYKLLDPESNVDDSIDEDDVIDVIPYIPVKDRKRLRRFDYH